MPRASSVCGSLVPTQLLFGLRTYGVLSPKGVPDCRWQVTSDKLPPRNPTVRQASMENAFSQTSLRRFGSFELELRSGELRKQGVKIKLQDQPLQILAMLLEHPGQVVTREELRSRLWPADTFVDFDHGLNKAINKLREALGDSADNPRFIETLARHGYRFIGNFTSRPGRIESLAVLPLENLSRNPEQEYFADGMTEALISSLVRIGALRVTSRTTAMHYKGVRRHLREIAQELHVDGIVEGTVLRFGDRVRISAQLVDANTDTHLWAESYDRDLRDVLALQSEVAQAIAREVHIKLTPHDQAHLMRVQRVIPEAYESYLKGRQYWNGRSREGLGKAVQYFQEAISKDPTYAAAYAGLADALSIMGLWGLIDPKEGCGRARNLARQALEMDGALAEAHTSLAWATFNYDYNFSVAEAEFERSLELNPRSATTHHWFGMSLGAMGRYEEAYAELKRALRLDPHWSNVHFGLAFVYWTGHRYDQAIEECQKALELDPNSVHANVWLGVSYTAKTAYDLAIAAQRKAVELSKGTSVAVACLGEAYAAAGCYDEAQGILDLLTGELAKQRYVTPYFVARIYAALGKGDEAFRWLETAYAEHGDWLILLKVDPCFNGLHSESRFQNLLHRMNFPEV